MENVKKYKTTIIVTTLITLLPIVFGLIIWKKLPEQIATHWGADGQADGYSGKAFAVFGMPCILAALQLFVSFITLNDPKRRNIHKKPLTLVLWLIPIVSILMNCMTYAVALGMKVDVGIIVSILIGLLFIILGNYMPKLQQNYTVGIRIPWTLNSTENWNRTHRLGRKDVYTGRVSPDHHRISRQCDRRFRSTRRNHRDRADLHRSADSVFILAVQKRGVNSCLSARYSAINQPKITRIQWFE